jgi:hypothetical protein
MAEGVIVASWFDPDTGYFYNVTRFDAENYKELEDESEKIESDVMPI